jgi:DNA-binding HxlR family transcriptional regulator
MARNYGQRCPMARSLEILGERWTLLIVRDLLRGPLKFQDLMDSLRAAPGLVSRRLKLLEERGIIARRMYTDHPPRAEYALTQRGAELRDVVRALTIWGSKHLPGERVLVHSRCDHPIEIAYRCAQCDETLGLTDITYRTEAMVKTRKRSSRRARPSAAVSTRRRRKMASAQKAIA